MALTREQMIRELMRFRHDPEYRGERRVPIDVFARFCGTSRFTLYDIMKRRRRIGPRTVAKVGAGIEAVLRGDVRFERHGKTWQAVTSIFGARDAGTQLGVPQQAVSERVRQSG